MTTTETFERVARHELTPEAAAQLLRAEDAARRDSKRPKWMPPRVALVLGLIATVLLSCVGVRRDD